ncbi:hypothetical protein FNW52_20285 [Flavobacterium sp. ZT3R18]|uniref:hypothetical protein n=1 Tax=Flavobacterium sp. ZT3R18 TaxID=2594429 RepID=UPI00117BD88B|nr:hypothetical protein [Flavobacterium sp. ZT3R18]TRX30284.1 hypothetical protein FNW52_20285 [Flavobacterium sp. ZT3R18]
MALDFHRLDNNELLFQMENNKFEYLLEIFETFRQWTGIVIDQYGDLKLTIENQETIVKIIEKYIEITDLNKNKLKTSIILEFKGLLMFLINKKIEIELLGD